MKKLTEMLVEQALQSAQPSCNAWQPTPSAETWIRERYGNAEDFLFLFSPTLQLSVAAHVEHAHMGLIPTLAQVGRCYGESTVEAVLCFELEDLNCFAGTKTKLEMHQQKELARIILTEFYYLKISEVLLFFFRLKSGRYGSFYGSVDAIQILVFLRTFTGERQVALERYDAERRRLLQEEERKKSSADRVTYEQYLEIKKRKEELKETIK